MDKDLEGVYRDFKVKTENWLEKNGLILNISSVSIDNVMDTFNIYYTINRGKNTFSGVHFILKEENPELFDQVTEGKNSVYEIINEFTKTDIIGTLSDYFLPMFNSGKLIDFIKDNDFDYTSPWSFVSYQACINVSREFSNLFNNNKGMELLDCITGLMEITQGSLLVKSDKA